MGQFRILTAQMSKLVANGQKAAETGDGSDFEPVIKLFNPVGAATWLITEIADDGDTLFGLCDLGFGSPELGYVSLSELRSVKTAFGLGIERDMHFKAKKSIKEYADEARTAGRIKE